MTKDEKKQVNYVVTTQGWSGNKVTECESEADVWKALGDCSFGALTNLSSPTGKNVNKFIPY